MAPPRKKNSSDSVVTTVKAVSTDKLITKYENLDVKFGIKGEDGMYRVLPTGSLGLDIALGIGGLPSGRIIEIAGAESSGKTTLFLKIAAEAQRRGYPVAFIDTEHALDIDWAESLGVDTDESMFLYARPPHLEVAGELAVEIAEGGKYPVIIFDSIAGAPILAVKEGELGDSNMGKRAKIMSDFMPKLNGPVKDNDVWFFFSNQLRKSLDMYHRGTGGQMTEDVIPGGKALDFHASIVIKLKNERPKMKDLEKQDTDDEEGYTNIKFDIIKNKMSPPYKTGSYRLYFNGQIDNKLELIDVMLTPKGIRELGIDKFGGGNYKFPLELIPDHVKESPEGLKQIEDGKFKIRGSENAVQIVTHDDDHFETVVAYARKKLIKHEDARSKHEA